MRVYLVRQASTLAARVCPRGPIVGSLQTEKVANKHSGVKLACMCRGMHDAGGAAMPYSDAAADENRIGEMGWE